MCGGAEHMPRAQAIVLCTSQYQRSEGECMKHVPVFVYIRLAREMHETCSGLCLYVHVYKD